MSCLRKLTIPCITQIYGGEGFTRLGVDVSSLSGIKTLMSKPEDRVHVVENSCFETMGCAWPQRHRIIFPGGSCSHWDQKISQVSLGAIRSAVKAGSHYVGICAGAYFACRHVRFTISPTQSIVRTRESLSFFQGTGIGPIFEGNVPGRGVFPRLTHLIWCDGSRTPVLVFGGGYFVPSKTDVEGKTYEVLARYEDEAAERSLAIVRSKVGLGTAILAFPHVEWGYEELASVFPLVPSVDFKSIVETFRRSPVQSKNVFERFLS